MISPMGITVGTEVRVVGNIRGQGQTGIVGRVFVGRMSDQSSDQYLVTDRRGCHICVASARDLKLLANPTGVNQWGGPGDWKNESGGASKGGPSWGHGTKDSERIAGIVSKGGGDKDREAALATTMAKSIDTVEKAMARSGAATAAGLPHVAQPFTDRVNELGGPKDRNLLPLEQRGPAPGAAREYPTAPTVRFDTPAQAALFEVEMKGQISDGKWENSQNTDWKTWGSLQVQHTQGDEKIGVANARPSNRSFGFNSPELHDAIGDRMLATARVAQELGLEDAKKYSSFIEGDSKYARESFERNNGRPITEKEVERVTSAAKSSKYSQDDLRRDLQEMQKAIKADIPRPRPAR